VKKQVEAVVDLVSDGELSKPSYATYAKDRLTGFHGSGNSFVYQDLAEFSNLAKRVFGDPGNSRRAASALPEVYVISFSNMRTTSAEVRLEFSEGFPLALSDRRSPCLGAPFIPFHGAIARAEALVRR
jgi:hypothetical protein